jgi:hypothetical protein
MDECIDHISGGVELKENMPRNARLAMEQKLEKIRLNGLLRTKTVIAVTEHMRRLRVKWRSTELSADRKMGDCRLQLRWRGGDLLLEPRKDEEPGGRVGCGRIRNSLKREVRLKS